MVTDITTKDYIPTGVHELDIKLGGGIPIGALGLIDGGSDVGKSVLSQHLAYSTLCSTEKAVAYYTTDYSVKDFIVQMDSLSLPSLHYFLLDRLRVYPINLPRSFNDTKNPFYAIASHLSKLPEHFKVVVVDSITDLASRTSPKHALEFVRVCKELCDQGRCVLLTAHSLTFGQETLARASSLCDLHIRLSFVDHEIFGLIHILEVLKVQWPIRFVLKKFIFEIKPKLGIQTIPLEEMRV